MGDDWQTLAAGEAAIDAQLDALRRICGGDEPALDVLCVAYVEEVVSTGKLARGICRAATRARAAGAAVPPSPETGGADAAGPGQLDLEPYAARAALPLVLDALARRSHQTPRLARWIFEVAKPWGYDCSRALAALATARVEPGDLRAGVESLVAFAAARPDPGGDIMRDVAVVFAERPVWLVTLLDRLAATPAAAGVAADGLYGGDLAREAVEDAGTRPRLVELAAAAPSGARALALGALGQLAAADDLEPLVIAALTDDDAHPRVIEAAARLALQHRVLTRAVIDAAERCAGGPVMARGERSMMLQAALQESVQALVDTGLASLAPPPRAQVTDELCIVEGDLLFEPPVVAGELAIAGYRRVLVAAPSSDWRTDDDQVGVAVVGPGVAALHVAPVRLPARAAGGAGARRAVEVPGVLDGRVVVTVRSPFSDERGWGNDCYALGCEPRTGAWVAYRDDDGRLAVACELPAPVDEAALPRLCFGEAIVWIEPEGARFVADRTPYHLDDWECDDAVSAAFARREAAHAQIAWRPHELAEPEQRALDEALPALWPAHAAGDVDLRVATITWDDHIAQTITQQARPRRAALLWLRREAAHGA